MRNLHERGLFDGFIAADGYGENGFDPNALQTSFTARVSALGLYVTREVLAHKYFLRLGAIADGIGNTAEEKRDRVRPGEQDSPIRVRKLHRPVDYDPEPGNSDARQSIRLSHHFMLSPEETIREDERTVVWHRRSVNTFLRFYNVQGELIRSHDRKDATEADNILRGNGRRGEHSLVGTFLESPLTSPGVERRIAEQDDYIIDLGVVATALGVPLVSERMPLTLPGGGADLS